MPTHSLVTAVSYLDLVDRFHEAMQYRFPSPTIPTLDENTIALRIRLITEEKDELLEAINSGNRLEQLDALCDIQYVLSGAVLALGLRSGFEAAMRRTRTIPIDNSSRFSLISYATIFSLKTKYMGRLLQSGMTDSATGMLADMQRMVDSLVEAMGFHDVFGEAFGEVHRNNMGKVWDARFVDMDNWPDLTFTETVGGFIARRADGKIVKPPTHSKVDLSRFIA